ncbi:MAG: cytochrome c oxidase subunit II [Candidatus Delongbacteria bacterium]
MQGASSYAGLVDQAFWYILGVSALLLVGITAVMIGFAVRYSRKRNPNPSQIHGSVLLETLWTVIPTLLVLTMFWYGWTGFRVMRTVPADALPIKVTARMWSWSFEYPDGRKSPELVVPAGRPVKVLLESQDVIHSFFVPAFRVKEDAMPGRVNHAWFQSDKPGEYDLFCAEYCGDQHSRMLSKVRVLPAAEYAVWQANPPALLTGPDLLAAKGCTSCHSLDGSRLVGPSFKALAGRRETVTSGGVDKEISVDEAYVRRSILEPKADLVKGYDPVMPEQRSQLTDDELDEIVRTLLGL